MLRKILNTCILIRTGDKTTKVMDDGPWWHDAIPVVDWVTSQGHLHQYPFRTYPCLSIIVIVRTFVTHARSSPLSSSSFANTTAFQLMWLIMWCYNMTIHTWADITHRLIMLVMISDCLWLDNLDVSIMQQSRRGHLSHSWGICPGGKWPDRIPSTLHSPYPWWSARTGFLLNSWHQENVY